MSIECAFDVQYGQALTFSLSLSLSFSLSFFSLSLSLYPSLALSLFLSLFSLFLPPSIPPSLSPFISLSPPFSLSFSPSLPPSLPPSLLSLLLLFPYIPSSLLAVPIVQVATPDDPVVTGQCIRIQFNITADIPPVVPSGIQWTFTNTSGTISTLVVDSRFSPDRLVLMLSSVGYENEGTYVLSARNEAGVDNDSFVLDVQSEWNWA